MKKFLKITSLVLCLALIFSACGKQSNVPTPTEKSSENKQNTEDENPVEKTSENIALPFNQADGLNPFFAKSYENKFIFSFIFSPLFELDKNYNPVNAVAESIVTDGNTVQVKIKNSVTCRGSSPLNAYDVVYSFNLAKSSYLYSGELSSVLSATAVSSSAVNFTLKNSDIFVAGKLTFPIVKEGTADIQTDVPTGSGEWYYDGSKLINIANSEKTIEMINSQSLNSAESSFKIGMTDMFFSDLSDCDYTGVTGNASDVPLNNMVFLGINSKNGALNKYVRSAIAVNLNCEDIALSSYQGHAIASKMPFNPESYYANGVETVSLSGNADLADRILDNAGFTKFSGKSKTNGAYFLSFSLIVNNDNRYRLAAAYNIADSLSKSGISVRVEPLSFADYNQRIASGGYDLYLGEIKLDGSMDISPFFTEGSAVGTGVDKTEPAAAEYFKYRAGNLSHSEYFSIFSEYYPFIPICFRTGYVMCSKDVDLTKIIYKLG